MTFVNYLNRFLRSGDRVVMVVKVYKLRYEFLSLSRYVYHTLKLFIINGEGVVFKKRDSKRNILVKHYVD
jgi:hypothetical protein